MSSNDVTITEVLAIALAGSNSRAFYEYPYSEHDRAEYRAKAHALMPALRAHFAAEAERNAWEDAERFDSDEQARLGARYEERIPEDVQALLAKAQKFVELRGFTQATNLVDELALALEAAYSQTGAVDDPR